MNYKVGDIVRINKKIALRPGAADTVKKYNWELTISNVKKDYYLAKETRGKWIWKDYHFDGLATDIIKDRFEILDL